MLQDLKKRARQVYRRSSLFRVLNPRRTHLFCVGTAKSGTSSIDTLFGDKLRSQHEAEEHQVINTIIDAASGKISENALRAYIRKRDKRLWLEVDSSQLNYFWIEHLVDLYPEAKFILTIRNPYAWLDSFMNHQLEREVSEKWWQLRDFRFRPGAFEHAPEETSLKKKGLYPLDGYLAYWASHNRNVLDAVPEGRLLVVQTSRITEETGRIAAFAEVPLSSANRQKSHANRAWSEHHALAEVDSVYLAEKVEEHCGSLMRDYFPELRTPQDALPSLQGRSRTV